MANAKLIRPKCVHCGSRYGSRDTRIVTHRWPFDTAEPPFECPAGHTIVESGEIHGGVVLAYHYRHYKVWNGELYGGYPPFCTLRCALDFARKAYEKQRSKP